MLSSTAGGKLHSREYKKQAIIQQTKQNTQREKDKRKKYEKGSN
jgi:hypothetical protein